MTTLSVAAVLGAVTYVGVMRLGGIAWDYTSDRPMKIENVELAPAQMTELNSRIAAFQEAVTSDAPARLVLTANEINAELSSRNDLKEIGIKGHIGIEGDKITAAMTMPCPIQTFGLKDRYINGNATIRILLQAGRLRIYVDSIEANGRLLPETFMTRLRNTNLAEKAMKDPKTAAAIAKLRGITIQNGAVVIEK